MSKKKNEPVKLHIDDYKIIEITKSERKGKKYQAFVVPRKKPELNNNYQSYIVHFGAIKKDGTPYEQYKDTAKGLYSKYDHLDPKRRDNYIKRHSPPGNPIDMNYINPDTLSLIYLWTD